MRINFYDAPQAALGFLQQQIAYIEPGVYKMRYADIQYQNLIPIDTSAPEWVKSIAYYSTDAVGAAQFFHHRGNDVPFADITRNKQEVGVEMAGIGYDYSVEELQQAASLGISLTADKAAAAKRAAEEFIDDVALRGKTEKNWWGLINHPDVTAITVENDGNNGGLQWSDKTVDQMLRDINNALLAPYVASLQIEAANTLLLPIASMNELATRRVPDTTMTALQFLQTNNALTAQTGQSLLIRAVRGLESAGAGGTGRAVLYRRDPQVLKMHIPMPHRFLTPQQSKVLVYEVPGIFRLGPLEIRRPGAIRYIDGILDAAYE